MIRQNFMIGYHPDIETLIFCTKFLAKKNMDRLGRCHIIYKANLHVEELHHGYVV